MLFHSFKSQEDRRAHGGSSFIELQFCKLPVGATVEEIVAVDSIKSWQDDSLYVDDENLFFCEYSPIFDCGIYNNLQRGTVDLYGINYYDASLIDSIIERLRPKMPVGGERLIEWLTEAKLYNGFYILGI